MDLWSDNKVIIIIISKGYGERISDKTIVEKSNLLTVYKAEETAEGTEMKISIIVIYEHFIKKKNGYKVLKTK